MNNKWNVYKTFKNGKRAKLPTLVFEAETENFFFKEILPTLDNKLQKIKWEILNSEGTQDRQEDTVDEERMLRNKKLAKVLAALVAKKIPQMRKKNIVGCLMMNKQTNWKWSWCAAESSTNKFLAALSPEFKCRKDADEWMKRRIEMNSP